MNCVNCGEKLESVLVKHNMPTNVVDCNCGSIYVDIPKDCFDTLENVKCAKCGKYPFAKAPIVEEKIRITLIEDEL